MTDDEPQPRDTDAQPRDTDAQLRDTDPQPRDADAQPRDTNAQQRDTDAQPRDDELLAGEIGENAAALADALRHGGHVPAELGTVRLASQLRAVADTALQQCVDRARAAGHTWQELGDVLGTSRQAAFQRFGKPVNPRTGRALIEDLLPDADRRALEVLEAWRAGRDEELIAQFDETMRVQLPPPALAETWPRLVAMVGAYESCGDPVARGVSEHTIVDVPMEFEASAMKGRVVFDRQGRIAGLFVLPPGAPPGT